METKQSQIKINLPLKLKKKIEKRAEEYDMTLAGYMKHLMIRELENNLEPSVEMKKIMDKVRKGEMKFTKVDDTEDFFDKL